MRQLEIIVRQIDETDQSLPETEALRLTFTALGLDDLRPGQVLDQLEQEIADVGAEALRQILTWRVEQLDAELAQTRQHETAACQVTFDGKKPLTVATVLGRIRPRRQVCTCGTCGRDFMPLNQLLPEHDNIVITRGLQELTCLFGMGGRSFEWAHCCLVRATRDTRVLSQREVQEIILEHGEAIRQLEDAQAEAILQMELPTNASVLVSEQPAEAILNQVTPATELKDGPAEIQQPIEPSVGTPVPVLVPGRPPRRGPDWETAVAQAVEDALHAGNLEQAPDGVSEADWERIVPQVRGHEEGEQVIKHLARLGPELSPDDLLIALDGIVVRGRRKKSRLELRIARLATREGYRYITGTGEAFLVRLRAAIKALGGARRFLVVLADGASWIRTFFEQDLAPYTDRELVLDWYHLTKKCKELLSMVARGRDQRRELLKQLMPLLWQGKVDEAIKFLEGLRKTTRKTDKLEELIGYLDKHRPYIPNYRQRRANCQFNSSNAAERACNTLVARRQKHRSMHWTLAGADALCALQTLWHNLAWDLYWKSRQILPLVASDYPSAFAC
jgi:hypothetical protein